MFTPTTGGRNGYFRRMLEDELRYHKGVVVVKKQLEAGNYADLLRDWCRERFLVHYESLCRKLHIRERTYDECRKVIDRITTIPEDIVFMDLLLTDELFPDAEDQQERRLSLWRRVNELPYAVDMESVRGALYDYDLDEETLARYTEEELLYLYLISAKDPDDTDMLAHLIDHYHDLKLSPIIFDSELIASGFRDGVIPEGLSYRNATLVQYALKLNQFYRTGVPERTYVAHNVWTDKHGVDFPRFMGESMIPNICNDNSTSHVISMVEIDSKRVCFSPMALHMFDPNIIQEAFIYATLCHSTAPGKRLMGTTDERDSTKFRVMRLSTDTIANKVKAYDAVAEPHTVLRANGIAFQRRGHMEGTMQNLLGVQETRYKVSLETVTHLDEHAALQQHLLCGRSFDEPVRTPQWLRENYIKAGGTVGKVDYPDSLIKERNLSTSQVWEANRIGKDRSLAKI